MKKKHIICLILAFCLVLCVAIPIGTHCVTRKLIKSIENQDYKAFQNTLKISVELDGLSYFRPFLIISESYAFTPLQTACKVGNYQMVVDLVERGADVNYVVDNVAPFSPLMCAVTSSSEENLEIVRFLIENGADVNYRKEAYDANALYQIMITRESIPNKCEMIDLIVENGGDIYYFHKTYGSLFNVACLNHNDEVILHLLKNYEFDPNMGIKGNTALIYYCRMQYFSANSEIVKVLLEHDADKNALNDEGKTAYDYAIENGFTDIAELLKCVP